jgi:DNA processing protein
MINLTITNSPKLSSAEMLSLLWVDGVGTRSLLNLISSDLNFVQIIGLSREELKKFIKGSRTESAIIDIQESGNNLLTRAKNKIREYKESGIHLISYWDDHYPTLLKQIADAPLWLYAKGNIELLNGNSCVAIIGTRKSTSAGEAIAFQIASEICSSGFTVVSGLARGIDSAAHRGALSVEGHTIAVLVDVENIFPPENAPLSKMILETGGLLISENRPRTKVVSGLLVRRDRLQSAISQIVIPVESALKGGTMYTVRYAHEQQRKVIALEMAEYLDYPVEHEAYSGIRSLVAANKAQKVEHKSLIPFIAESAAEYSRMNNPTHSARTTEFLELGQQKLDLE